MNIRATVEQMITGEPEWALFFQQCCESGVLRLETQANHQFRYELRQRGYRFSPADLEDAMLDLARELCPDSPAADNEAFDDWASEILKKAFRWLGDQGIEASHDSYHDALNDALQNRKRTEFRRVAREWVSAQAKGKAA